MPTPYPDLLPMITELEQRSGEASDAQRKLLTKWIHGLEAIHLEMRKLEKLEKFSSAVREKKGA